MASNDAKELLLAVKKNAVKGSIRLKDVEGLLSSSEDFMGGSADSFLAVTNEQVKREVAFEKLGQCHTANQNSDHHAITFL